MNTRYSRSAGYNGTYPSISTILGATRDYGALYKWQRRLVLEHGAEYLQALMAGTHIVQSARDSHIFFREISPGYRLSQPHAHRHRGHATLWTTTN